MVPRPVQAQGISGRTDFQAQVAQMAWTVYVLRLYVVLQSLASLVPVGTLQALELATGPPLHFRVDQQIQGT